MYKRVPVGKFHIQLCGTTPCMLGGCGAKVIKKAIQEELGIGFHNDELTPCKMFSYEEVEIIFKNILRLFFFKKLRLNVWALASMRP